MPRIPDEYLENVFYLYPDDLNARNSVKVGGTGFFIAVFLPSGRGAIPYAVTNRHVIENGNTTMRLTTIGGEIDTCETPENEWIFHPEIGVDLAVLPILLAGQGIKYKTWPMEKIVSADIVERHDIGPGDECFTVGRFIHNDGRSRNTPSTRMGNIAQMPSHDTANFLVEMRTIGGASGSPVYFYRPPAHPPIGGNILGSQSFTSYTGPYLLGVVESYVRDRIVVLNQIEERELTASGRHAEFNTGMMNVIPGWRLEELINSPEQKHKREIEDEKLIAAVIGGPNN